MGTFRRGGWAGGSQVRHVTISTMVFDTHLLETFVILTEDFGQYEIMRSHETPDERRGGGGGTIVTDDDIAEKKKTGVKRGLKSGT